MTARFGQAHACTVVVRNRLPFARVLAAGYRAQHPGGAFTALLLDDHDRLVDDDALPFDVVRLDALDLTQEDIRRRALAYPVAGLVDSLKPVLLSRLLADHEVVLYLEPDIAVYTGLDHIADLAGERGLVLTPQTLAPVRWDGLRPSEADVLDAGAFSLDFLAVSRAAKPFLQWWSERASAGLHRDPERAGARSWTALAPGYFPHALLDDPGSNVAYWNLDQRALRHGNGGYEVDGVPLRFFHFRGYDPRTPWLLTAWEARQPRVLLSTNPAVRRLCDGYRHDLITHGWMDADAWEYGFGRIPDGTVVDEVVRAAYRRALVARGATAGRPKLGTGPVSGPPPDPFDPAAAAEFVGWLAGPDDDWPRSPLSRYLSTLWSLRPDLQQAFPHPHGRDAGRFIDWAATSTHDGLSAAFVDGSVTRSRQRQRLRRQGRRTPVPPGANVVGYPRGQFGLGESTRATMAALGAARVPFQLTGLPAPVQRHRDDTYRTLVADGTRQPGAARDQADQMTGAGLPYDVTLLCANADATPAALAWLSPPKARGRRTVGMWYWELERLPPALHPSLDLVDEVWVASEFVRASVRKATSKPVRLVRPAVRVPQVDPELTRSDLGLPTDAFLFLFVFDFYSVAARKNPLGLVEAYRSAFGAGDGTALVLKIINADMNAGDAERLRLAIADRPDVILLEQTLPDVEKNSLIGLCDAYVSLHRSEGFGLTMAEAMALGKPVIATAYSGNRMFMRGDNSYLVPYTMTEVPAGAEPYPPGYLWADPDLGAAAELMRFVRGDYAAALGVAERGRATVLAEFSLTSAARDIWAALAQVRSAGSA